MSISETRRRILNEQAECEDDGLWYPSEDAFRPATREEHQRNIAAELAKTAEALARIDAHLAPAKLATVRANRLRNGLGGSAR